MSAPDYDDGYCAIVRWEHPFGFNPSPVVTLPYDIFDELMSMEKEEARIWLYAIRHLLPPYKTTDIIPFNWFVNGAFDGDGKRIDEGVCLREEEVKGVLDSLVRSLRLRQHTDFSRGFDGPWTPDRFGYSLILSDPYIDEHLTPGIREGGEEDSTPPLRPIRTKTNRHPISARLRLKVYARSQFRCSYCGISVSDSELTVDHVVPISKGGTNDIENLRAACRTCNSAKGVAGLEDLNA